MKRLQDNVTIVTGGGKGIGFGLASAFAKEGSNLVITGRNEGRLLDAKKRLEEEYGVKVLAIAADGADETKIKEVIAKTIETFGKINTLINNAQASKSGLPLIEHTREDFDLAINSGLYATFFYMREAFPYLKETKGSVINFASGAGLFGKPGQSSYAAAKEGIRGLSISNAAHLSAWLGKEIKLPVDEDVYYAELQKKIAAGKAEKDNVVATVQSDMSSTF